MKLKFGYDVSNLTAYVDEQKNDLLLTALFSGSTFQDYEIQDGIKYKDVLNYLETEVIYRANTGCPTFTATGDTVLSQREIEVDGIIFEQAFCPNDLEDYFARKYLTKGQYYDSMAFEADWVADQNARIAKANEVIVWQGNKSTGSGNNALINGFLYRIDNETGISGSGAVAANVTGGGFTQISSGTGITTSNVVSIFNQMITKLPIDVEGNADLEFNCGWDTFKKLLTALQSLNNFFYDGINSNPYQTGSFSYPTFGITVKARKGLDGTNRVILWEKSNPVIGTDMISDFEQYQMWYEQKDDKILTRLKAKMGTQLRYPERVVQFTLA